MVVPDPKWLEVFKLPLRTAIAVAIATDALLALVLTHILDLGPSRFSRNGANKAWTTRLLVG
jgi:hypothetical protein